MIITKGQMVKMESRYNDKALLALLLQIPPDFGAVRTELESGGYSSDTIARIAVQYVDICSDESIDRRGCERHETEYYSRAPVVVEGEHSTYLYTVVELLLEYGLEPKAIVDGESILDMIRFVENEYIAADTLALLFEHGGDVHLKVDGMPVFGEIDFDVLFGAYNQRDRRRYDSLVHCWFVWLGYGARLEDGETGLDVFRDYNAEKTFNHIPFDIAKLKEHRNYTFGLSHVPGQGENWSLHIFDKQTMWEIARL